MNKTLGTILAAACMVVFLVLIIISYAPFPEREPSKVLPYVAVAFLGLGVLILRSARRKKPGSR